MLRFKGEKKIVLVVVGVKIFPYGTGIAGCGLVPAHFGCAVCFLLHAERCLA